MEVLRSFMFLFILFGSGVVWMTTLLNTPKVCAMGQEETEDRPVERKEQKREQEPSSKGQCPKK